MAERTELTEKTAVTEKPKKIWDGALKMVKGEDSAQLIENFTAEMTLVAEGLCEDQNRLRGEVNQMINEEDRRLQKQESSLQEVETRIEEQQRENDRIITEMRGRLATLEKQANARKQEEKNRKEKKERYWIRDLTILIAVAAVAIIAVILVQKYA